jgi:hypothetical protein
VVASGAKKSSNAPNGQLERALAYLSYGIMLAMMLNSLRRAGASLRCPWCSLIYVPDIRFIKRTKKDFLSVYDLDFVPAHATNTMSEPRLVSKPYVLYDVGIAVQTATGGTNT